MGKFVFGVDLGGTTVKMGLFADDATLLDKWEIPTDKTDKGAKILPDIAKSIEEKIVEKELNREEIIGVGIGVPGPVDKQGVIYKAPNLGWDVFNVNDTLSEMVSLPVKAGNDANVAALGEMWKGGGAGYRNLVTVTLGTGVGGGIIIEGDVLAGFNGSGGEIGHIHVEDNEEKICGCGNKGCLEQYASATGMVYIAKKRLAKDEMPSVLRETDDLTAKMVWDAVKAGDAVAIEIAEQFGKYLGKALAGIACVVNPEIIVIGGGVSKAGEVLLDYIVKNYKPYVFFGSRETKFALATLGNDAGIYGAARLVIG